MQNNLIYFVHGVIYGNSLYYQGLMVGFFIDNQAYTIVTRSREGSPSDWLIKNGALHSTEMLKPIIHQLNPKGIKVMLNETNQSTP